MGKLFEYALLRVVPRVERGEFINAGVVLHCSEANFLDARVHLDQERLSVLDPALDHASVLAHLEAARLVCAGDHRAGPIGLLPRSQRFGWLGVLRRSLSPDPRGGPDVVEQLARVHSRRVAFLEAPAGVQRDALAGEILELGRARGSLRMGVGGQQSASGGKDGTECPSFHGSWPTDLGCRSLTTSF